MNITSCAFILMEEMLYQHVGSTCTMGAEYGHNLFCLGVSRLRYSSEQLFAWEGHHHQQCTAYAWCRCWALDKSGPCGWHIQSGYQFIERKGSKRTEGVNCLFVDLRLGVSQYIK